MAVHFHQNANGTWVARNGGSGWGKERHSPSKAPFQWFDGINAG